MAKTSKIAKLEKKAAAGDLDAQFYLAIAYEDGRETTQDLEKSFKWCMSAALAGDKQCQYKLSKKFGIGSGIAQRDPIAALHWLEIAAASGHIEACFELGYYYLFGIVPVKQSITKARKWLGAAAKKGHGEANYYFGQTHLNGPDATINHAIAFKYFLKAASLGSAKAQCALGYMFEHGIACQVSFAVSKSYYEQAAKKGHAGAQYALGCVCQNKLQSREALYWLEKAAQRSVPPAQSLLVNIYMKGLGVKRDYVKALCWCFIIETCSETSSEYFQNAHALIKEMKAFVPQHDVDTAYTLACEWLEKREIENAISQIDWDLQIKKEIEKYAGQTRRDEGSGTSEEK